MWYMAIVKSYDPLFMKKIAVMSLVPNLQFSAIHDSGKGPSIQASLILNKIIQPIVGAEQLFGPAILP